MSDGTVRLVIKSPNNSTSDFYLESSNQWKVTDLKQYLSENYPEQPSIAQQRLIYSGKLLSDDQLLVSALNCSIGSEENYVLHLVISQSSKTKASTSRSVSGCCTTTAQSNSSSLTNKLTPAELLQYQQEYELYLQQYFYQQLLASYSSANGPFFTSTEQLASGLSVSFSDGVRQRPNNENLPNNDNLVAGQAPPVGPGPAGNAADRPNRNRNEVGNMFNMLAGEARLNEDDLGNGEQPQDFMDTLYSLLRVLFVGALVYFYSSIEKALFALIIFGFVFVLQGTYFRELFARIWHAGRAVPHPLINREIPIEEAPQIIQENPVQSQNQPVEGMDGTPPAAPSFASQQSPILPQERFLWLRSVVNILKTTAHIFITFFTSLIPERPPPIEIN